MSDQVRLFLGVEISLAALRELTAAAEALRRKARAAGLRVRWVAPESYHVTLKFLGWTRPEAVAAIVDALIEPLAAVPDFAITGRGQGAFPAADHARVLWAGVDDPSAGLTRLAEIVETTLAPVGFAREPRAFHAHVTLGRIREPGDVQGLLTGASEKMFRESRVGAVTLFESVLKSSGSEYRVRARFGLREAAQAAKRQTESLQAGSKTASKAAGTSHTGRAGAGGSAGADAGDPASARGWQTIDQDDQTASSSASSTDNQYGGYGAGGDDDDQA